MRHDDLANLVAEHGTALSRFCSKLCRGQYEAEELYQETWCRAVEKIHLYNNEKPFQTWLFTICVNIFRSAYRKSKKTKITEFNSDEEKERAINNAAISKPVFNEENDMIRQAVNELDAKHRIVVVLHYFGGYSMEEIASIAGIPRGTVKSRLHKARETIRGRLEDEGEKNNRY